MAKFFSVSKNLPKWLLPLAIIIFGAILRLACLDTVPGGCQMDEAYGAWNAFSLYHVGIDSAGQSYPVYFQAWGHGQNALNSYLMFPFIALNGGHVSLWVIRAPQFLVSVAALAAIYFLMRKITNENTALWAVFLAAICPWHIMVSRWGLESNLAPGFLMLGLCFFAYGLETPPLLLLSALCYGFSLYSYAVIWPVVPIMLLFQAAYSLYHKRLRFTKWSFSAVLLLGAMAFPLMAFLLVNTGYLPEFHLGPFSIYKMVSFRGNELAHSLHDLLSNFKNLLYLFYHQDVGRVYDVIMPYGFFYGIGRIFIIIGIFILIFYIGKSFLKKEFSYLFFLFVQLVGAFLVGLLLPVNIVQINCAYLPLVLCEAIGVVSVITFLSRKKHLLGFAAGILLCFLYLGNLAGFQKEYYTEYKELTSAWYQQGADEAVRLAFSAASRLDCAVYVNAGLKYPNVLLSTETTAQEYLDTVVYSDYPPAPSHFSKDNVTFYMGFEPEDIIPQNIYVCYYTDLPLFEEFELTQFYDWYVAIPKYYLYNY